jgi:acyl-CoA thioesterase FadM
MTSNIILHQQLKAAKVATLNITKRETMNLYFRIFLIICKSLFQKNRDVLSPVELRFRAWPQDCDLNFHLTNARYFSFMDLARLSYTVRIGLLQKLLKRKWAPVVASCEITFIRPIKPLQKITVTTQILTWDEKYQYFFHRFICHGKTYATALVKTAAYSKGTSVPSQKIIALVDASINIPEMPESVKIFRQLNSIKRQTHG